uniref:Uncharacterized protein n=1 Tax=Panagrellus redivivus TaxID=6233 RepID=A0A7E4V520_PANRE
MTCVILGHYQLNERNTFSEHEISHFWAVYFATSRLRYFECFCCLVCFSTDFEGKDIEEAGIGIDEWFRASEFFVPYLRLRTPSNDLAQRRRVAL